YGVCSIVAENRRSDIPAEQVGREELACRTEPHQMPLSVVLPGVSAEYDASIRKNNRRSGSVINHTARRRLVRIGGNPRVRALPTTARFPIGRNQIRSSATLNCVMQMLTGLFVRLLFYDCSVIVATAVHNGG